MRHARWWEPTWTSLRIATALVIVAAITAQYVASFGAALHEGRSLAVTSANFFSYFTILANLGSAVVLLWAAWWWCARGRHAPGPEPRALAVTLACMTTYMLVTGVVFNALLRGIPLPPGLVVPWSNEVLHVAAPALLLADLLLAPRRRRLAWGTVVGILIFPIVWIVYTMVRGPLTESPATGMPPWYPYPFLYPDRNPAGYLGVMGYIVAIAALIALFGALTVGVGRWRTRGAAVAGTDGRWGSPEGSQ